MPPARISATAGNAVHAYYMQTQYFRDSDILYIRLRDTRRYSTRAIDDRRLLDLDEAGEVVGIEFLVVSEGVDLTGLPENESAVIKRALVEVGSLVSVTDSRHVPGRTVATSAQ
jgi:uncharacterized protein YuzE